MRVKIGLENVLFLSLLFTFPQKLLTNREAGVWIKPRASSKVQPRAVLCLAAVCVAGDSEGFCTARPGHRRCLWSARKSQISWKLGKKVVERSGSLLSPGKELFRDVCGGR